MRGPLGRLSGALTVRSVTRRFRPNDFCFEFDFERINHVTDVEPDPSSPRSPNLQSPATLFVDQTGQLGGAELCLFDLVTGRASDRDRVVLLAGGPFEQKLRGAGVVVDVVSIAQSVTEVRKASGLGRFVRSAGGVWRTAGELTRRARGHQVLYANTAKALVIGTLAARRAGIPVVYHLHDILSADHFSSVNRRLLVALSNAAAAVIVNSRATGRALAESGGRTDHVTVVYNGIDPAPLRSAAADQPAHRAAVLRSLRIPADAAVLGLFGRLSTWKGQMLAVEAVQRLPGAHLLLVGDALFGEDEYVRRLDDQINRLGLGDRVHRMGFRDDVPVIMQACDVVLHCSTSPEPFGRVIAEAMIAGRPVVAAAEGGAGEIVTDGQTGMSFAGGDAEGLLAAVRATLHDPSVAAQRTERARRWAAEQFDPAGRTADVSRTIAQAAARAGGRSLWQLTGPAGNLD